MHVHSKNLSPYWMSAVILGGHSFIAYAKKSWNNLQYRDHHTYMTALLL